ncbi:hypothetical protein D3C86_1239700 [compost metagenome]
MPQRARDIRLGFRVYLNKLRWYNELHVTDTQVIVPGDEPVRREVVVRIVGCLLCVGVLLNLRCCFFLRLLLRRYFWSRGGSLRRLGFWLTSFRQPNFVIRINPVDVRNLWI